MMEKRWKTESVVDAIVAAFGAGLFVSPWILGFAASTAAGWSAWVAGLVIAALAIAALIAFAEWQEWTNVAAGFWTLLAPWTIGFAEMGAAMGVHLIAGIAVVVLAAVRLWFYHWSPPRVTA